MSRISATRQLLLLLGTQSIIIGSFVLQHITGILYYTLSSDLAQYVRVDTKVHYILIWKCLAFGLVVFTYILARWSLVVAMYSCGCRDKCRGCRRLYLLYVYIDTRASYKTGAQIFYILQPVSLVSPLYNLLIFAFGECPIGSGVIGVASKMR